MKSAIFTSGLASLMLLAGSALASEQCQCRTTVIVIEMPEEYTTHEPIKTVTIEPDAAPSASFMTKVVEASATTVTRQPSQTQQAYTPPKHKKPPVNQAPPKNTTQTYKPCAAPQIDRKDPKNFVPAKNVQLAYAPADEVKQEVKQTEVVNSRNQTQPKTDAKTEAKSQQGSIDMNLAFKYPAVVLEHIESVAKVSCGEDLLTVSFSSSNGFNEAVKDWDNGGEPFVLVTGALDEGCAAEFERGYFVVAGITKDAETLTVEVAATKGELPDLAGEMEMVFTSIPAGELMRRLTVAPSWSLELAKAIPEHTTLFTDGKYIDITAEEAWFSTKITFSGKLKYNFWKFKLQELYFDLDAVFDSSAVVSAQIRAAFQELVQYKPDDLAYSLVDVPGIVSLGPGLAFGLSVNVQASAAVDLYVGADMALPAGNVHIDFLDGFKTTTTGWEPKYNTFANASQSADVALDVGADLSVMLQFKLLGGLVDLSSGFTASPGVANSFKLRGKQQASVGGNLKEISAGIVVPKDAISCADTNGLEFVSDFFFSLSAYATKWWKKELYAVRVPIVDYCLPF